MTVLLESIVDFINEVTSYKLLILGKFSIEILLECVARRVLLFLCQKCRLSNLNEVMCINYWSR